VNAYEELVERAGRELAKVWTSDNKNADLKQAAILFTPSARAVLAEVLRTLETVTDEMLLERPAWNGDVYGEQAKETFIAMLRASPIAGRSGRKAGK